MTALPIVGRELRVAARRRGTYRGRMGAAFLPVVAIALFWPAISSQPFAGQGKMLFALLSSVAFLYSLFAGALLTADCLSVEKRNGTIGLLFLTDLKGYDVVLGKLVSSSLHASYGLLAVVPMLALALLLGGVTLAQVGLVALVLLNTLFFSLSAGLFVSSVSRDPRKALYATVGLLMLVALGPYAVAGIWALKRTAPIPTGLGSPFDLFDPVLLTPSPVLAFHITQLSLGWALVRQDFIRSVLTTHLLSFGLLGIAGLIIRYARPDRPKGRTGLRWQELWNRWSFGAAAARRAFRAPMLDRNAFYWLAARDRLKARCVWLFVGTLLAMWFWGWWTLSRFMFGWDVSTWLLFFTYLLVKVWLASEVCMRFVEDRQCGALELILCSPLNLGEIARGQMRALWWQFGTPVLVIIAFTFFLRWGALHCPHNGISDSDLSMLFWAGLTVFAADLFALACVGVHQATRRTTLNRALTATYAQVLLLPWIVFGVSGIFFIWIWRALNSNLGEVNIFGPAIRLWLIVSLWIDLVLAGHAIWSFFKHFREAAAQRYSGPAQRRQRRYV